MLDPAPAAFLVRAGHERRIGIPLLELRSPHRLRFRADSGEAPVALELLAIAAVDQAPVVPGLGDDRGEFAHAASASCAPTEATAARPSRSAAPASHAARVSTPRSCASNS